MEMGRQKNISMMIGKIGFGKKTEMELVLIGSMIAAVYY